MTNIERNETIRFHERGTLEAVTSWIANHHDGLAEWLKNVRRQYQVDRGNVKEEHRVALLLLRDAKGGRPARIGVFDVGGATLEDVTAWSTWQDPDASKRGSGLQEEETQGNGGKAYMFRLFTGPRGFWECATAAVIARGLSGRPAPWSEETLAGFRVSRRGAMLRSVRLMPN